MDLAQAGEIRVRRVPRLPRPGRGPLLGGILIAWVLLWIPLHGRHTLSLSTSDLTPLHDRINEFRDYINANRSSSGFFTGFVDVIRIGVNESVQFLQHLISQPAYDRPVPVIGWLGVVALAALAGYAVGNWRIALLAGAGFISFGLLGLWQESMDTLALTIVAVLICLVIGIPLGVLVGLSRRAAAIVTPVLDLTQAMPTFCYLAPVALFFLIGPASAVIVTVIYAIAPVVRTTAHGIAGVSESTLETSNSLGATRWQLLRKVRVPLARPTIVVGINQTVMCALSMVTIAALISAPGLGQTVVMSLRRTEAVGAAFVGGLALVIMAIVLDRATTAASTRSEMAYRTRRAPGAGRRRRLVLGGLSVLTAIAVYLSYTYRWAAFFPTGADFPFGAGSGSLGEPIANAVDGASDWAKTNLHDVTEAIKNGITYGLINPLQALLAESPWYLVCAVMIAVAATVAGLRAAAVATVCLGLLIGTGLWSESMVTLASTIVATVITIAVGIVVGIWIGRSRRADTAIRPILDAAQVMPAFVYLVPVLGLFGPTRLTAIVAAVVFAAPVVIKLVADAIRGVPATVVEAATAAGSSNWQIITKVQLPLARRGLVLAANQGLIYVLSMVVVGGLVGAGALGYLVVAGLVQSDLYGKGLAAGVAIVLLGIGLDRVSQAAARRAERTSRRGQLR
jgi:glycine betaine/proline transport system permease protein